MQSDPTRDPSGSLLTEELAEADPAVALDDAIRALVTRLARPHPSGGHVVERAAIMAAGTGGPAVLDWIAARDGRPEELPPAPAAGGLYGARADKAADARRPRRYVLPHGALG